MSVMDWLTYGAAACLLGLILVAFESVIAIIKTIKEERNASR